jgi:hypothetical protein
MASKQTRRSCARSIQPFALFCNCCNDVTTGPVIEVLETVLFSSCRRGWSDIDPVREIAEASKVTGAKKLAQGDAKSAIA